MSEEVHSSCSAGFFRNTDREKAARVAVKSQDCPHARRLEQTPKSSFTDVSEPNGIGLELLDLLPEPLSRKSIESRN